MSVDPRVAMKLKMKIWTGSIAYQNIFRKSTDITISINSNKQSKMIITMLIFSVVADSLSTVVL